MAFFPFVVAGFACPRCSQRVVEGCCRDAPKFARAYCREEVLGLRSQLPRLSFFVFLVSFCAVLTWRLEGWLYFLELFFDLS